MAPLTLPWFLRAGFLAAVIAPAVGHDLQAQDRPDTPDLVAKQVQLAIVRHHWQAKIVESNHAALRPGSVYDMITYFEQNFGFARPRFKYRFLDTGLGTADPLYPLYQSGFQAGWSQLLPAFLSKKNRHLDHFSSVQTPEGCRVDAVYLVRHVDDFPDRYHLERAEGCTLVDIAFSHYTRLTPDAQCGRHVSHDPDPDFDPLTALKPFLKDFTTLSDIPPALLSRYEAKVSVLKPISEEFSRTAWPRYDETYTLKKNSLWYYPDAYEEAYGIRDPRPQLDLESLELPEHFVIQVSDAVQEAFGLRQVLDESDFGKFLDVMNGHPTPGFDPATEPGNDAFSVDQVTASNFYTSGLEITPIETAAQDISNPDHYKLVGMVARPYEPETDMRWTGTRVIPQVRLTYQLMDPLDHDRPFEQVYLHLIWDVVDRYAPRSERDAQHRSFLGALDDRTSVQEHDPRRTDSVTADLIRRCIRRPIQTLAMSSSLTGIWVFSNLSRSFDPDRQLSAMRIVRQGIDVGYYSTAYDTDLFRQEMNRSTGERKEALQRYLDDLTPRFYRDPRRMNPHTIDFNRITCAQCHQTAARDGVHLTINDGLDRRITSPVRASEFIYREIDRQLRGGADYWD